MKTPHQFYLETNGKYIGNGQCWGLWDKFTMDYVNAHFICQWTGGAKDMWYHFKELHLDRYFEQITDRHKLQDGDWLVWDADTNPLCWISKARNDKGVAYGHIAMFRQYNPSNPEQNVILTQNPGGNPNYTYQMVCDFLGFVGALRPKCYIKQDKTLPTPVERDTTKNQFKINCDDTVRVRLDHSLNGEFIGFGKTGFYNILQMVSQDGYNWYEVEKGKWCALVPPYSEFVGMEENKQETPQNEPKEEDGPIIPIEPKTPEIAPKEDKKEHNKEQSKEKSKIFSTFIDILIDIIKKIFKK